MARHRIKFNYSGNDDDNSIDMAFSKKKIEERKAWLTKWMAVSYSIFIGFLTFAAYFFFFFWFMTTALFWICYRRINSKFL